MSFAENLQRISTDRGLTITELSQQANIPKRTVHAIWNGESKDPKLSNIVKIAIALGTSTDKLIFDEDEKDDLEVLIRELNNLKKEKKDYAKKVIRAILIQTKHEELSS